MLLGWRKKIKERETVTLELKKPKIYDDNSISLFSFLSLL